MVVLHQCLVQPALSRLTSDAPVINIAGRQRMLSQKVAKSVLALAHATDESSQESAREELKSTLAEWRAAHQNLWTSCTQARLPLREPDTIELGFRDLDPHFQAMAHAADRLIAGTSTDSDDALKTLLEHEPRFLKRMHALVGVYERAARMHVEQLQWLGLGIMAAIVLSQVALQMFVVRPAAMYVGREFEKSEAKYQRLVESMTDGVVVFDMSGRVEFANPRFGTLLGHEHESIIGKPASLFIADPDRRRFSSMLADSYPGNGPVDLMLHHADGSVIETMISAQRLCDHDGQTESLLLVITDVTARRAMEQRTGELLAQLAHANRLKSMGAMAAALAHEINQPLGAIANYAEGCLTRLSDPQVQAQDLVSPLEKILRATHRGAEIVRRSRSFVRPTPHQIRPESINNLVCEVEELCRPEARRRGISLELQLEADLIVVPVDGIQIQQVLTNLIQNAFAAMESIEPYRRRVKITTRRTADNAIDVSVADNGPGIPEGGAESWFEPFVTTREDGTGMGLAIVRGIVEAHRGRIWAEADRDGGAVFRFVLPIQSHPESITNREPIESREACHV